MPKIEDCTHDFYKAILLNEKYLLQTSQIKFINVPRYDELSVSKMLPMIIDQNEVMRFLPNNINKQRNIDRVWFMNVINTVIPNWLPNLISYA